MRDINNNPISDSEFNFTFGASTPSGANLFFAAPTPNTDPVTEKVVSYTPGTMYIDVNGPATPNKYGRDVFAFVLSGDGHLYPYGSKNAAKELGIAETNTWDNADAEAAYGCGTSKANGLGCTYKLVEDGYHMKY